MPEYLLKTPLKEDARFLKVKDVLYLTGNIITVRDMAYARILDTMNSGGELPFDLKSKTIWHAGPITKQEGKKWKVVSVGSTTSSRFTIQASQLIEKFRLKLIIGKGSMGEDAMMALARNGAAYAITTGGTAAYYADKIEEIKQVYWLDLGMPSAVWVFKVKKLGPLIVAMDSNGGNIFDDVKSKVRENINHIYSDFKIDSEHNFFWWP